MTAATLVNQFQNVRRVSTPLVVVRTTDGSSVAAAITAANQDQPILQWDIAAGFQPRTKPTGVKACELICGGGQDSWPGFTNPAEAVTMLAKAPAGSIVFLFNAHRVWNELPTVQAIWNLRDLFKSNKRTLVLLTTPEAAVVRELESDTIILDDPLPDEKQLADIIASACENSLPALPVPDAATMSRAVDALKGLSAFVAEQVVALALRKNGINLSELWERKRQAVEQTPGATIYRGQEKFSDIGGHDGLKRNLTRVIKSKRPVKVVVIFDEFEKMLAGTQGDTSGVSQDQAQQILTFMQDHQVRGTMLMGHPGAGKSIAAKAMANEAGCLCILADMGAMKGSLVGESEARVRAFFNLILAIAGDGGAFFVATCNSTHVLTTEIRRRFKTGFFFVDLPSDEEKAALWSLKMKKFNISKKQATPMPDDTNWTGAEIESCCEKADDYGISLVEAASEIVPVAQAQPRLIEQRRQEAHGTMLSAATGVTYQKPGREKVEAPTDAWIVAQAARQTDLRGLPES